MRQSHLNAVVSFFETLGNCKTPDTLRDLLTTAVAPFGVKSFHYYSQSAHEFGGSKVRTRWMSTFPPQWVNYWIEQRYQEIDIWCIEAIASGRPTIWSDVDAKAEVTPLQRQVRAESISIGLGDGLIIPIRDHGSDALIILAMENDGPATVDGLRGSAPALNSMAVAFHYCCSQLLGNGAATKSGESALSPRETEVLRWIAAGKTDWEIAQILSISPQGVKFHVNGARRKLLASNRTQAVAKAIAHHMIDVI